MKEIMDGIRGRNLDTGFTDRKGTNMNYKNVFIVYAILALFVVIFALNFLTCAIEIYNMSYFDSLFYSMFKPTVFFIFVASLRGVVSFLGLCLFMWVVYAITSIIKNPEQLEDKVGKPETKPKRIKLWKTIAFNVVGFSSSIIMFVMAVSCATTGDYFPAFMFVLFGVSFFALYTLILINDLIDNSKAKTLEKYVDELCDDDIDIAVN